MVFSTNTILASKEKSFELVKDQKLNNNSIFIENLQIMMQENINFQIAMNNSGIRNINESIHATDVLKSLIKKIDFKKILINLLKKFVELLDKMGKELEVFMASLINKNTVIKHYKKQLQNFEKEVNYSEERYIYTNLRLNTSYTSYKSELDKVYSTLVLDLTKLSTYKTYEAFYRAIEEISNECSLTEDKLNNIRGKVLGTEDPIAKEDFPKYVFNYFRNGGSEIGSSTILPAEVRKACSDYFDYSKNIKMIQKDKHDMKDASEKLQKDINNLKLEDYIKDDLPPEANNYFARLLNNKCIMVKELCDIYLQIFSIKLDAIKEAHTQNSKILFEACKMIIREGEK